MEDRGGIIGAFSMTSYNSLMRLNVTSASSSLALRRFTTLPSPQTTIFLASGSMVKVSLNSQTLADSNDTVMIEGNHYFPPSSINKDVFSDSQTHTTCPWKGEASYYNVKDSSGKTHCDVAWYYPHTKTDRAKPIEGYVAFYKNKVQFSE